MNIKYVETPNLPEKRVFSVILGYNCIKLTAASKNLGINTINIGANCAISPNVQYHADMSVFHAGYNRLIISKHIHGHDQLCGRLAELGFEITVSQADVSPIYPGDVGLNACLIGDKLFHKSTATDKIIVNMSDESGWSRINVNQGYTKCSICILDRKHIITSDTGIHKAAQSVGIKSLLISPGQIALSGYDSGFIGGACGKISKDEIAFTGTLKHHKDESKIIDFINQAGMKPVFLTDEPIFDVGSIIPVLELNG